MFRQLLSYDPFGVAIGAVATLCLFLGVFISQRVAHSRRMPLPHQPIPSTVSRVKTCYETEFFGELLHGLSGVTRYAVLEFYVLADGVVLESLCRAIRSATQKGAEIYLIYDGWGSHKKLTRRGLALLKESGATVKKFDVFRSFPFLYPWARDHRKLAVFDGQTALVGGVNLADEYANLIHPYGLWRDSAVLVQGAVAKELLWQFLGQWHMLGGELDERITKYSPTPIALDGDEQEKCEMVFDVPPQTKGMGKRKLLGAIRSAKRRIWLLTPYLCPDEDVYRALRDAVLRGVSVMIAIPSIPDRTFVFRATMAHALRLGAMGVDVRQLPNGFLHAKNAAFDDVATVGSYNLDNVALRHNCELGLWFYGKSADDIAKQTDEILRVCSPICAEQRNFFERVLDRLAYLLSFAF